MRHKLPLLAVLAAPMLALAGCGSTPGPVLPRQPPPPVLASWTPTTRLADNALSGGAPAMALQVTDQLLARNPRDTAALVRKGHALAALDRAAEADTAYATALTIDPRSAEALLGLGRLRLASDPAAAEALFVRAVALDPRDGVALSNIGVARDLQGRHDAAQEAYRQALGVTPSSIAVQVNMGLSLALSGNAGGAVRLLRPLATSSDATPRMRQNLALALTLDGRRAEASNVLAADLPGEQLRVALDGFEALRR